MWKQGAAPFDKARPTYVAEPQELPNAVEAPSFQICHLHDGVLTLPRDIRSMFLQDPVRSPEWKDLLRDFDRCYGAATDSAQGAPEVTAGPAVDWSTVFPDAPQFSEDKVKAKYSFAAVQGITCYFVIPDTVNPENGDENLHEFWVSATGEATIPATVPILTYGAGSWLLDGKVETALRETPTKIILWEFRDCNAPCLLEDGCWAVPTPLLKFS